LNFNLWTLINKSQDTLVTSVKETIHVSNAIRSRLTLVFLH